jgi:putative ABC transport system ATP-binding protein
MTTQLELAGVTKTFRMGEVSVRVLRGVDLSIDKPQFLAVVGPSGSGKSTLLNLMAGIDHPTEGSVRFRDCDLTTLSDAALTRHRREHVGFVFQFYNLVPTLTALENVALAAELVEKPLDPREMLDRVGLADRADHFPAQLSGGEQQRVSIARALCKDPDLLLCDEPTGALDLETARSVLGLLRSLCDEYGKTVILVTHNAAIAGVADRVIRLGSGIVESDTLNERPVPATEVSW